MSNRLSCLLGTENYSNVLQYAELSEVSPMFVSGSTASGKTVYLSKLISDVIHHYTPNELHLVIIGAKCADEYYEYSAVPHLLCKIPDSFSEVESALNFVKNLIDTRNSAPEQNHTPVIVILDDFGCLSKHHRNALYPYIRMGTKTSVFFIVSSQPITMSEYEQKAFSGYRMSFRMHTSNATELTVPGDALIFPADAKQPLLVHIDY